jgi:hypothetical protein
MAKYTVRVTNDDQGIIAWVDQDGAKCIMQPNLPGETEPWASEAEALAWANAHAADMEANYEAGIASAALKEEREAAQHAANLAMVALLERLTNPSA